MTESEDPRHTTLEIPDDVSADEASAKEPEREVKVPVSNKEKKGRGNSLSLLAVVLSLGALAAVAYNFLQLRGLKSELTETETPVDDHSEINTQFQQLNTQLTESENELKAIKRSQNGLERKLTDLDTLTERIQGTEKNLENLQGVSESARQTWVLSEAQYYLQSANTRLQLAGDIATATAALKAADDRLSALGDPSLYQVREMLADEILSLEAIPQPDLAGMALQLASLGEQIPDLPLRTPLPEIEANPIQADDDKTGVDRAMSKVLQSVKGLVTVRKTGEGITPLMTQQEEYLLVRNLQLQLQSARLALLQKRQSEFQASLRASRLWIDEHFETDNQAVANTLSKLTELEAIDVQPTLPDISGSLKALRNKAVQ